MSGVFSYAKTFDYDPVGNRLEQTTTVGGVADPDALAKLRPGTVSSSYDERDRLLNEAGQSFGWDENGNLTTKVGEATYTWDDEDRLVGVTKADGSIVTHVYDADGNRVQTTTVLPGQPAQVVNYLVDTSGGLSQVVAETNGAGVLVAYYVRGDDLLGLLRPDGAGGFTARYYHADGIGSVRALTNQAGSVTDTYRYTAFGELLEHVGTDPQAYAFTGEPLDPNVGWQYHRARWMDPATGRFAGMDPWGGETFDLATLHRYLYAAAAPTNNYDSSGRSYVGTTLTGISIAMTFASAFRFATNPTWANAGWLGLDVLTLPLGFAKSLGAVVGAGHATELIGQFVRWAKKAEAAKDSEAAAIAFLRMRGVGRFLTSKAIEKTIELLGRSGRSADIVGEGASGGVVLTEAKSVLDSAALKSIFGEDGELLARGADKFSATTAAMMELYGRGGRVAPLVEEVMITCKKVAISGRSRWSVRAGELYFEGRRVLVEGLPVVVREIPELF